MKEVLGLQSQILKTSRIKGAPLFGRHIFACVLCLFKPQVIYRQQDIFLLDCFFRQWSRCIISTLGLGIVFYTNGSQILCAREGPNVLKSILSFLFITIHSFLTHWCIVQSRTVLFKLTLSILLHRLIILFRIFVANIFKLEFNNSYSQKNSF